LHASRREQSQATRAKLQQLAETTLRIPKEGVISYKDATCIKSDMHHLYVQAKNDLARQEFPTSYRLPLEDVNLLISDWEDDWKNPTDKLGSSQEDGDQEKSEEEEDHTNGAKEHLVQSKVPKVGLKRKDQELEKIGGARTKAKVQC
jgi:hypothetical protein